MSTPDYKFDVAMDTSITEAIKRATQIVDLSYALCNALREFEGELILCGERVLSPFARKALDRATVLRKQIEALKR